jgi:hypothetical protein
VDSAGEELGRARRLVALGFLLGLLLSPRLWLTKRSYPLTPAFDWLPAIPDWLDPLPYGALLVLSGWTTLSRVARPRVTVGLLALVVTLGAADQTRIQPWVYEYWFLLWLTMRSEKGSITERSVETHQLCRIVLAALYFWSGVQKLTSDFGGLLVDFSLPFLGWLGFDLLSQVARPLAPLAALFESAIGIALLSEKWRRAAVWGALAMHAFILASLLVRFSNTVVWPWNLTSMALLWLLFHRWRPGAGGPEPAPRNWRTVVVVALFAAAPWLSLVGWWDHYPSFALYSGTSNSAVFWISQADGKTRRGAFEWSMEELNVPPYPQERVFRRMLRALCDDPPPGTTKVEMTLWRRPYPLLRRPRTEVESDCDS